MKLTVLLAFLALIIGVYGLDTSTVPDCAIKCWDNSAYVSACKKDIVCLCDDPNFQNAVFQCLHSQCNTVHFGAALHHTLETCSNSTTDTANDMPPLLRYQGLRKRTDSDLSPSVTLTVPAPALYSAVAIGDRRRVPNSVVRNTRATRSVGGLATSTRVVLLPTNANYTQPNASYTKDMH